MKLSLITRFCPQATEIGRAILSAESGDSAAIEQFLKDSTAGVRQKILRVIQHRINRQNGWLEYEKNCRLDSVIVRKEQVKRGVGNLEKILREHRTEPEEKHSADCRDTEATAE